MRCTPAEEVRMPWQDEQRWQAAKPRAGVAQMLPQCDDRGNTLLRGAFRKHGKRANV
jgi:methylmalonyl-CoA mutase cobalamin-binding subunit